MATLGGGISPLEIRADSIVSSQEALTHANLVSSMRASFIVLDLS